MRTKRIHDRAAPHFTQNCGVRGIPSKNFYEKRVDLHWCDVIKIEGASCQKKRTLFYLYFRESCTVGMNRESRT
jgi:hypothetical protein